MIATVQLDGLRIHKRLVERLGCIKGCLGYLGRDVSLPWLYGGTGHAFIISLDPGVDVSSPDSWNHQPQFDLGSNLGYTIDGFRACKETTGDAFPERQREAWNFMRANIDQGVPCFVCEDALAIHHEVIASRIKASTPFVGNRMWVTDASDPDGYQ